MAGSAVALGELGIEQRSIGQVNLQISTSKFKVLANEFGNMEINSDLRVTGEVAAPTATGEIATEPGRLEVDQISSEVSWKPLPNRSDSGDDDGSGDRSADDRPKQNRAIIPASVSTTT